LLCTLVLVSLFLFGCLAPPEAPPAPEFHPNNTLPPQQYVQPTPLNTTPTSHAPFEMTFIDAGYGDATLLRSGNLTILFDTGPAESSSQVVASLRARGIEKIDILILSSTNPLYTSGASALMRQFNVAQIWTTGDTTSDAAGQALAQISEGIPSQTVRYGFSRSWDQFNLTVLNPADPLTNNPSADSIVLKASYGSFCALLFSDSEASGAAGNDGGTVTGGVDARIITGPIPINCQVIRVAHHGSGNAASFPLLERASPDAGIISVGPNPPQNLYPEPTLIRRLVLKNVSVYTTDRLGSITVTSDGSTYSLTSARPADAAYWRGMNDIALNGKLYWVK
jgi:competence protein ComEC